MEIPIKKYKAMLFIFVRWASKGSGRGKVECMTIIMLLIYPKQTELSKRNSLVVEIESSAHFLDSIFVKETLNA